jgi:hypothetical protein
MESAVDGEPPTNVRSLRHQLVLLRSAIALVASGASYRVTLTGLQNANLLFHAAQEAAARRGLIARLTPRPGYSEITVEAGG